MNKEIAPSIIEEKNIYDDNFLDIVGKEFKFDHEKGLSEWLKNSVDAYITSFVPDNNQYVFFRFTDGKKNDSSFECIDFVGMTKENINNALKRWGDPNAAKKGSIKLTYGGHGNGGKFYMRQMFSESRYITYKNGILNIFGFNKKKKYGFLYGFKEKKLAPREALKIANINQFPFPEEIRRKIIDKEIGFTVVKGTAPSGMKNKVNANKIVGRMRNHPQSRNIFSCINIGVIHNEELKYENIKPEKIKSMSGFEKPIIIKIPENLSTENNNEIILVNKNCSQGELVLMVSEMAFTKNSRFGPLNRIDFQGKIGVIASYQIATDLAVRNFPQVEFIYGECNCPILEDPINDAVKNDRTKLAETVLTRSLLDWIGEQIDKLAAEIAAKEDKERKKKNIEISSAYNDFLNKWKNQFMGKVLLEAIGILEPGTTTVGNISKKKLLAPLDLEFSYPLAKIPINEQKQITLKARVPKPIPLAGIITLASDNSFIKLENNEITIKNDYIKKDIAGVEVAVMNLSVLGKEVGAKGNISATIGKYSSNIKIEVIANKDGGKKRKSEFPRVLLSSIDIDPLGIALGGKVILDPRQPLVYQRPQDIREGIYWINTSAPLANAILQKYKSHSLRWRDFLFQRYVDIFVKEALFELQKREPESFRAERIDSDILGNLVVRIHSTAVKDLTAFLFDEEYEPPAQEE